jgi:hypothetical protein
VLNKKQNDAYVCLLCVLTWFRFWTVTLKISFPLPWEKIPKFMFTWVDFFFKKKLWLLQGCSVARISGCTLREKNKWLQQPQPLSTLREKNKRLHCSRTPLNMSKFFKIYELNGVFSSHFLTLYYLFMFNIFVYHSIRIRSLW